MLIETQITPDADVMNFFPNHPLLEKGQAEFVDAKSLRKSPLAEALVDLGQIVSVFIAPDMISVKKESSASWEDLKPLVMAEIMDFLATGEKVVLFSDSVKDDEIVAKIKGLLDARIRPAVKQDGGDIAFLRYEDGIVYFEMRGACAGCPYAAVTLKEGVEKILKTYIPEVKAVENSKA